MDRPVAEDSTTTILTETRRPRLMLASVSDEPTLVRDTPGGRAVLILEHVRLLADQALQAAELALTLGSFQHRDAALDRRVGPALTRLTRARALVREAREALRA
jgi:hypothetical protein